MRKTFTSISQSNIALPHSRRNKLVEIGDAAPDFELYDHAGIKRSLSSFRGRKVMLSFDRFPACPTCTYSVERLQQQAAMLKKGGIVTLSIFGSITFENIAQYKSLVKHCGGGDDSFALIDDTGDVFTSFMEDRKSKRPRSTIHSAIAMATKQDTVAPAGRRRPADFLIDEEGVVVDLCRSDQSSDHLPFDRVEAFISEENRCRCNRKDCFVPRCRENYQEIMREAEKMIHRKSIAPPRAVRRLERQTGFRVSGEVSDVDSSIKSSLRSVLEKVKIDSN